MLSDFSLHLSMDGQETQNSFLRLKDRLVQNKKNVLTFIALLVVACCFLSSSFFVAGYMVAKLIQVAGFIAIGYMHISMLKGPLASLTFRDKQVYSIVLATIIVIISLLFGAVTHRFHPLLSLACACAFLLFFVVDELWNFYAAATETKPALWYYSSDLAIHQGTVFLNSLPVKVKVQIDQQGRVENIIRFRAPVKMKLGLVFYHMVQDQNRNGQTPVDFIDRNNQPYGWAFFTAPPIGLSRYLDPEESLVENGIKPNATIIVRRVSDPLLLNAPARQNQIPKTVV